MRRILVMCLLVACAHAPSSDPAGEALAGQPLSFGEDTVPPVRKKCRKAGPELGERDRASGRLILDYLVTEEGRVKDVSVKGDASAGAVRAIRSFLSTCTYRPALQNGKPVAMRWKGELNFPTRAPDPR